MQLKKSTLACALALAAAPMLFNATGALAQSSSSGQPCTAVPAFGAFDFSDTLTIYLSGATAPSRNLSNQLKEMFTKSGDAAQCHTYHDDAGNPNQTTANQLGRLYYAHLGQMRSDTDIPASLRGRKVLFIKREEGGSVWGVNPVARAPRMRTLAVDSTNCNATVNGVWRCSIAGIDPGFPGADTADNNGRVSDFGVSDVEPAMFKTPFNVELGQDALSTTELNRLISTASTTLMMGIATSNAVPTTTTITRAQYANMLMGNLRDWSVVDASIPDDGKRHPIVCRRVQGSGTQTSYNWYFNNFPCQEGVAGTVAPARMIADSESFVGGTGTANDPITFDASLGYTVIENSGSGDVRNCLARANSGTDHTFVGDDKLNYRVIFPGGGYRAIGVLSLDSRANANPNQNGWYFRPLDGAGMYNVNTQACESGTCTGIVPSKQNLLQGSYDFAVEVTFQRRNTTVVNAQGDNTAPVTGERLALINELVRRVSAPGLTDNSNASLPNQFTPEFDASGNITNSVARAMRGFPTANTCKPLQYLF